MIALEVSINGRRVCLAGAEALSVLNATLTLGTLADAAASAQAGETAPSPHFHVGGVTRSQGHEPTHLRWAGDQTIRMGDVLQLRFVEVEAQAADAPDTPRQPTAAMERGQFEFAKARYLQMKERFEPQAQEPGPA